MASLPDLQRSLQDLKSSLTGEAFTTKDAGFFEAAALFNKAVKQQPQFVVLPENNQDIIKTIAFAHEHNIPLSIKNGGHDWAGRAIVVGGIQLNMRRMNRVTINPGQKTAVVQGGALSIEVIRAAGQHNLLPVTGTCDAVGYIGLTLGGGYSPLSSCLGLSIDNVIGAEIILDDGTVCKIDDENYPDLFWAIRGGGGNFGVVTSLTIRLHDAKPLLAGSILFNGSDAMQVLQGLDKIIAAAPSQFAVDSILATGPEGKPVLNLMPFWFDESISEGEKYIEALKQLAVPIDVQVKETTYGELIRLMSENLRKSGSNCYIQTRSIPSLNNTTAASMTNAINNSSSPLSLIYLHLLKGEAATIPAGRTSFPLRKPHYMVEIIACWGDAEENILQHAQWAYRLSKALEPSAFPGGYANLVGPDDTQQIAQAFGDNLKQLQKIKKKYDPDRVFNGVGNLDR